MSLDQLRKRIKELKEKGFLGSGYTAPELSGMGDPYQNQSPASSSRSAVDNAEKLGYTPVKTTGYNSAGMQTANEYVPNIGAAPNSDTAGSNNTNGNSTSENNAIAPYKISDSEKELNYMMDMMFLNGAGSSSVPSVQMAYEWVSNPDNKGKPIPQEVLNTYYGFMGTVDNEQIARSNQIAVGKGDEIGLVEKIYETKAVNQQSDDDSKPTSPYYPGAKNSSTVSTSLANFVKSTDDTKQNSNETVTLGKAGQTALKKIIKPNPDVFGTRSGYLYEAFQAGLNGADLPKELRDSAAAGNFLDEIEKMYKAGETDAKIAAANQVPKMGDGSDTKKTKQDSSNKEPPSSINSIKPYIITPWEKDFDYIQDMMFLNGAANSADPSIQAAYQYFTDINNKGKVIPQDILDTFQSFIEGIDFDKRIHSHGIVTGVPLKEDYAKQMVQILTRNRYNNNDYGLEDGDFITSGPYKGWRVNQGFDDQTTIYHKGHLGYDLGGEGNSEIYPILPGEIVAMHWNEKNPDDKANGISIVIKHTTPDGRIFYSSYSHLSEIDPKIYDGTIKTVGTDTKIGTRGGTGAGNQDVSHLHLAVFTTETMEEITNPIGYTIDSKISDYCTFEKSDGCDYNYYYCLAPRDLSKTFYDPFIVMKTYGAIIDLFPIIR